MWQIVLILIPLIYIIIFGMGSFQGIGGKRAKKIRRNFVSGAKQTIKPKKSPLAGYRIVLLGDDRKSRKRRK